MSFQEALKKLQASNEFKSFMKKNKKSFLFSAFFVLNTKFEVEKQQLDYFLDEKKAATFSVNDEISLKTDEFHPTVRITPLDEKIKIDIDKLQGIIKKELEKKSLLGFEIGKIIAILQKINNVQMWNITCMMSSLKILKLHIDCFNGKIISSEEANVFDFLQIKKSK